MVRFTLFIAVLAVWLVPANAQNVIRAQCPDGYVHQGEYCVGQGVRLPFFDFLPGGRWFGMHHFNHGRPVVVNPRRHGGHNQPGRHQPGRHGRH